jgi:hypothetical protein
VISHDKFFYGELLPTPNPQTGGPPPVGCPRLLIEYILSYPPYLEGVSSIHNLRTHHAVVTRDPPNILLDRGRHSSILDVRSFRAVDCDTDHYLVVAKVRERLGVNKQCTEFIWSSITRN